MYRAVEMEALARMYYLAIAVGRPAILSDEEVARIVERFKTYGGGIDAPKAQPPIKKRARGKAAATKRGARRRRCARRRAGPSRGNSGRSPAPARHQQLRGDRGGDHRRVLAFDAR